MRIDFNENLTIRSLFVINAFRLSIHVCMWGDVSTGCTQNSTYLYLCCAECFGVFRFIFFFFIFHLIHSFKNMRNEMILPINFGVCVDLYDCLAC